MVETFIDKKDDIVAYFEDLPRRQKNFEENYNEGKVLSMVRDIRSLDFKSDIEEEQEVYSEYARIKKYISDEFGHIPSAVYDKLIGKVIDKLKI